MADLLNEYESSDDEEQEKDEDELKELEPRHFYFKVDKMKVKLDGKFDNVFLQFEIGGVTQDVATEQTIEKMKTKTRKDKDGNDVEFEVKEVNFIKRRMVKKVVARNWFSKAIPLIKNNEIGNFKRESFEGFWPGSYADLHGEKIKVTLWHYKSREPNTRMAEGTDVLFNIASGKMERQLTLHKYKSFGSTRKEYFGTLTYKIEFQEQLDYSITFRDWTVDRPDHRKTYEDNMNGCVYCWETCFKKNISRCCCCATSGYRLGMDISTEHLAYSTKLTNLFNYWCNCCSSQWCGASPGQMIVQNRGEEAGNALASVGDTQLIYPGTRTRLEDEVLQVQVTKGMFLSCCGSIYNCMYPCFGKKMLQETQNLQGVLDYGFVKQDDVPIKYSIGLCSNVVEHWDVKGALDVSAVGKPLARYRQVGNVDPDANGNMAFLVVNVLSAKNLYTPNVNDFKETLNPSVTVEWLRVKQSTETVEGTSDPYWDDAIIYFKIPDKASHGPPGGALDSLINRGRIPTRWKEFKPEVRESKVLLTVWDNDAFQKTPLGYCELSFRDLYKKREQKRIVSFTSNGKKVERHVLSIKMDLDTSFVVGDDNAGKPKTKSTAGNGSSMAKMSALDENERTYLQFEVYFDRQGASEKWLVPRDRLPRAKMRNPRIKGLSQAQIERATMYWNDLLRYVPNRKSRFFPFYGQDEHSGRKHFLPTFLGKIVPPKDIRLLHNLLYFIYSIECVKKGVIDYKKKDLWVWSDPYFFLEKRKGDVRDHAVLLCNFLLGLNKKQIIDSFVCIGSAITKKKKPEPHVWVMTKEIHEVEDEDGKLVKRKVIRFWETTNGRTYELEGDYMFETNDLKSKWDKLELADKAIQDENEFVRTEIKKHETKVNPPPPKVIDSDSDPDDDLDLDEKDMEVQIHVDPTEVAQEREDQVLFSKIRSDIEKHLEQKKLQQPALLILTLTEIEKISSYESRKSLWREIELRLHEQFKPEHYCFSLLDKFITEGVSSGKPEKEQLPEALEEENELELLGMTSVADRDLKTAEKYSVFEEKLDANVNIERETFEHQQKNIERLTENLEVLDEAKNKNKRQTPYLTIDVVFNDRKLYANLQREDPELITYSMNAGFWAEFTEKNYQDFFKIKKLPRTNYDSKSMVSLRVPLKQKEDAERTLTKRIENHIKAFRDFAQVGSTQFITRFKFQKTMGKKATATAYLQERLEKEFLFAGGRPENTVLRDMETPEDLVKYRREMDGPFQDELKDVHPGFAQTWIDKLRRKEQPGTVYKEQVMHFKHCDGNRIADSILEKCDSLLRLPTSQKPQFAVGVRMLRLAATISPVRVIVCVLHKPKNLLER